LYRPGEKCLISKNSKTYFGDGASAEYYPTNRLEAKENIKKKLNRG
jgi:phage repressor protein C with HTH and peptisase S24 domain